jgi:ubiquitin-protein ligase E3 C
MFNQQELQVLLGGVNAPVDIDDLRANTTYGGLYDNGHATIEAFWRVRIVFPSCGMILLPLIQIVSSLNQEERRKLLKFVTSCSRPPLLYVLITQSVDCF